MWYGKKQHNEKGQCSKPLESAINLIEHEINWVHLSCLNRRIVTCIFYVIWLTVSMYNAPSYLQLQEPAPEDDGYSTVASLFSFKFWSLRYIKTHVRNTIYFVLTLFSKPLDLQLSGSAKGPVLKEYTNNCVWRNMSSTPNNSFYLVFFFPYFERNSCFMSMIHL